MFGGAAASRAALEAERINAAISAASAQPQLKRLWLAVTGSFLASNQCL